MARYGDGTVYQRADGSWAAQLVVNGKRVTRYAPTKKAAQAKLRELRQQAKTAPASLVEPTPSPTAPAPTVSDFVDQWLATAGLKPASEESYRNNLRAHVLPVIGALRLDQVTATHVARVIADCRAQGKASRTAQYAYTLTRRLLQVATDWEIIPANPAARVKRPAAQSAERVVWTVAQTATFTAHCQEASGLWGDLFLLALLSGLRLGELLGLEWRDIDWDRGCLTVRRNVVELKGPVWVTQAPKSRSGIRTVALPAPALVTLRQRQQTAAVTTAPIFRREDGQPPRRHALATQFARFCRRAGVPYIGLHGLRHQHVSLLAHAGVPVKVAQQRVGHATPVLTLGIYTHVLGDADQQSATALERLFGEREATPHRDEPGDVVA